MSEPTLRELMEQRFDALETLIDERRDSDLRAVNVAKETADAALEAHNQLIRQMRDQASESQRQLDKLTDTYATKENLVTLEALLDQRLTAIESAVNAKVTATQAVRGAWSDLRSVVLSGFVIVGGLLALATYFAQN